MSFSGIKEKVDFPHKTLQYRKCPLNPEWVRNNHLPIINIRQRLAQGEVVKHPFMEEGVNGDHPQTAERASLWQSTCAQGWFTRASMKLKSAWQGGQGTSPCFKDSKRDTQNGAGFKHYQPRQVVKGFTDVSNDATKGQAIFICQLDRPKQM
jgi:hypothetical protein